MYSSFLSSWPRPLGLLSKHHPQHTQKALHQLVYFGNNRLDRLARRPSEMVLLPRSPLPLRVNRIQLIVLFLLITARLLVIHIPDILQIHFVQAEIGALEGNASWYTLDVETQTIACTFRRHLLASFVLMPLLPRFLPCDQGIDFSNSLCLVELTY